MELAYVLGTGPTLPVAHLHRLSGEFTVGVNTILRTGFTPSVVFYTDRLDRAVPEDWEAIRTADVVRVCRRHPGWTGRHDLELVKARPARSAREIDVRGNTGTAAARWCLALGFERVALVGCSGHYSSSATSMPGGIHDPDPERSARYLRELERLRTDHGDRVFAADAHQDWICRSQWGRDRVRDLIATI